jgi:hypothetical protein
VFSHHPRRCETQLFQFFFDGKLFGGGESEFALAPHAALASIVARLPHGFHHARNRIS